VLLQDGGAGEQEGGDEAQRDDDQHSWGLAPAADAAPSAPRMAVTIGGKRRPRSSFGRPGREGQRADCRTRPGARLLTLGLWTWTSPHANGHDRGLRLSRPPDRSVR
jgi:hypothetical protein